MFRKAAGTRADVDQGGPDRFMVQVAYLQEVSHEVVDSDPPVQPFFLTGNDGDIVEVEGQGTQVFTETCHDFIGPLFILLT